MVDDDPRIAAALRRALVYAGFAVETAASGPEALERVRTAPPDLLVLDVMLPGVDGVEVCRRLRAGIGAGAALPILMLTARDAVGDRVRGLDVGADDYLTKPFATEELLARVRALLRRAAGRGQNGTDAGHDRPNGLAPVIGLTLDPVGRDAWRGARSLTLTAQEFDLLLYFAQHPGEVLGRDRLLDAVWGVDAAVTPNVVDVYVGYLRQKLEAGGEPRLIQTVRGVGFVLRSPRPMAGGSA